MTTTPRILSVVDVAKITGLSKRTIYSAVAFGDFPQQVQLTARRVGWVESEVEDWIAKRMAAREQ